MGVATLCASGAGVVGYLYTLALCFVLTTRIDDALDDRGLWLVAGKKHI